MSAPTPLRGASLTAILTELEARLAIMLDGHRVYMSPSEAADFGGFSERTLFDLPIPKIKIGRLVRYDRADLIAFMDAAKQTEGGAAHV